MTCIFGEKLTKSEMKPFDNLLRVNKVAQIRSEDTVGTTQSLTVVIKILAVNSFGTYLFLII